MADELPSPPSGDPADFINQLLSAISSWEPPEEIAGTARWSQYAKKFAANSPAVVSVRESMLRWLAADSSPEAILARQARVMSALATSGSARLDYWSESGEHFISVVRLLDRYVAEANAPEAEQAAAEIAADPANQPKIKRVLAELHRPEVAKSSQWVVVLVAVILMLHVFGLLPAETLSAEQGAFDDRLIGVLTLGFTMAALVKK
jgi:hypothetical protein